MNRVERPRHGNWQAGSAQGVDEAEEAGLQRSRPAEAYGSRHDPSRAAAATSALILLSALRRSSSCLRTRLSVWRGKLRVAGVPGIRRERILRVVEHEYREGLRGSGAPRTTEPDWQRM